MGSDLLLLAQQHAGLISAAVGGIASANYFRRNETSLRGFITLVLLVGLLPTAHDQFQAKPIDPLYALQVVATFVAFNAATVFHYRIISRSHPLHDIPGPFLARLSQAWLFTKVWRGQTRHDLQAIHEKYGDVVRIGPNEVSVSYPEAILQIHGSKAWIKGASYSQTASGGTSSSKSETSLISIRDHAQHSRRRKLWDKALSTQSLRDYQEVIGERLQQLCSELSKREGQVLDLHEWIGFFVWDVMTDLAYGGGGTMIREGRDVDLGIHSLCKSLQVAGLNKVMPWISPLTAQLPKNQVTQNFKNISQRLFEKRCKQGRKTDQADVFFHLLGEGTEDGTNLTQNELAADSALVIAAGADTTRLVLCTLFMFMMRDRKRYSDLQKVIDEAIGKEEYPSHEALAKIKLLDAYLNEALRLNPPVPFANQRESPEGGAQLQNFYIPAGIQVRIACYKLHRDPRYFADAEMFKPERWLGNENSDLFDKSAFFPFLFGPYHCPGKLFALQEMRLLVATIVRKYDMSQEATFDTYKFEKSFEDRGLIEIHEPFSVILTARK